MPEFQAPFKGCKALIIEETNAGNGGLSGYLSSLGFYLEHVSSAAQAITMLVQATQMSFPFRVVFLDQNRPTEAGRLIKAVMSEPLLQDTKIFDLSPWAEHGKRSLDCASSSLREQDNLNEPTDLSSLLTQLHKEEPRTEESGIDQMALDGLRMLEQQGAPGFLSNLIKVFLKDADRTLNAMKAAASSEELMILKNEAHSFKSTSATFGATRLSELCRNLECSIKMGITPDFAGLVKEIEMEYRIVRPLLEKEIEQDVQ